MAGDLTVRDARGTMQEDMKNPNFFLIASVALILLTIGLLAILNRSKKSDVTDVRARAGSTQTLNIVGTVIALDESNGTIDIQNVIFAEKNRSGEAQNLGAWRVTTPAGFNFTSTPEGTGVTIGVDPTSFQVTSHTMTALTIDQTK